MKLIHLMNKHKIEAKRIGYSPDTECIIVKRKIGQSNVPVEYEDTKQYYYISYEYTNTKDERSHPFWHDKELFEDHSGGEIVFKNKMTEEMINHLLMTNEELCDKIGLGTPDHYKVQIMKSLAHYKVQIMKSLAILWD